MAEEYDEAFGYEWVTKRWSRSTTESRVASSNRIFSHSLLLERLAGSCPTGFKVTTTYWREKAEAAKESGDEEIGYIGQLDTLTMQKSSANICKA